MTNKVRYKVVIELVFEAENRDQIINKVNKIMLYSGAIKGKRLTFRKLKPKKR